MKKAIILLFLGLTTILSKAQVGYVKGSNFGNFLKASYVYKQFDALIEHTSKKSIELYGKEKLKTFYKSLKISKQETWDFVSNDGEGNSVTQYYTRSLNGAYSNEISLNLVKENGEWKIVLPKNLSKFLK